MDTNQSHLLDNANEKYESFYLKFTELTERLLSLEGGLRFMGSTGYTLLAERRLRKILEEVMFLYAQYMIEKYPGARQIRERSNGLVKPYPEPNGKYAIRETCKKLYDACETLMNEIYGFVGIYYSEYLMRLLLNLCHHLLKFEVRIEDALNDRNETDGHVQELFHYLEIEMPKLAKEFAAFKEHGVPMIQRVQKEFTLRYLNMTAIATFFAGVTVAMLQFTYEKTDTPLAISVNTLLFSSLVFSLASAAQNLLVLTWRQSHSRSPEVMKYQWQSQIILKSPIACLVLSGVLFYIALCLFLFSSHQDKGRTAYPIVVLAGFLGAFIVVLVACYIRQDIMFRREARRSNLSLTIGSVQGEVIEKLRRYKNELELEKSKQQDHPTPVIPTPESQSTILLESDCPSKEDQEAEEHVPYIPLSSNNSRYHGSNKRRRDAQGT